VVRAHSIASLNRAAPFATDADARDETQDGQDDPFPRCRSGEKGTSPTAVVAMPVISRSR